VSRDSDGQDQDWNLLSTADYEQGDRGLQGSWRDEQKQTWLFVGRRLDTQGLLGRRLGWVVFAQPQPNRRQWFAENLLRPLLLAGLIGLALSALLAWLISRSVARPLQQVADAAHAIARGDYAQTVPVSGPAEVRDLADDFNAMAQQVRVSRDAQRDFVANVSHELKTPLTSIQGYSQAILDGTAADAETVGRSAGIIHDEAERMGRMVSELLDLARIESGQITMRQEPVSLSTLLETLIERFRLRADEARIALAAQLVELPSVIGDGDRLTQVFANLLDNALKHTPQGGKVTVSARLVTPPPGVQKRKPAPPASVEVAVSDSGAGIPPEDLARVFERFYQVDKSRKHTGSVGLGLAIAREIVEAHGGSIKAESVVGLGTRITVLLPVRTT
jgi:signal transduction histidine kinase